MLDQVLSDWPLKLLALGLAFAIWVSVIDDIGIVQDFEVPLVVELPEEFVLTSDPPTAVTVRLRGPETMIRRLDSLSLAVVTKLDGTVGEQDVTLSGANVSGIPRGLDLEFLTPDRLRLALDREARRRLPVVPTLTGKPPEGFVYFDTEVRPRELQVVGPESEVLELEQLKTNPIRLDGLTEPLVSRSVTVPDLPHVDIVEAQPLEVRVLVYPTPVERPFAGIPVVAAGSEHSVELLQASATVTISGPPTLLNRLRPEQFLATVDLSGQEPRTQPHRLPLQIDLGNHGLEDRRLLSVKRVVPELIEVRISERTDS